MRKFEEEIPFEINIVEGVFEVTGARIEKRLAMTILILMEGLQRFQKDYEKMGCRRGIKKTGNKDGDTVRIGELEFEFTE